MKREIKFKRAHFDHIGTFINLTEWGFIDGGFVSPSSIYGEDKKKAVELQFTGLRDKNGKEIYEGDIINSSYFKLAICVWWQSGWYLERDGNHFTFNTAKHTLKIIGNIYQTPEQLK